jgi:hypothetical protein
VFLEVENVGILNEANEKKLCCCGGIMFGKFFIPPIFGASGNFSVLSHQQIVGVLFCITGKDN